MAPPKPNGNTLRYWVYWRTDADADECLEVCDNQASTEAFISKTLATYPDAKFDVFFRRRVTLEPVTRVTSYRVKE